jgi:hypothetical protein
MRLTVPTDNCLHHASVGASKRADPRGNIVHTLLIDNPHHLSAALRAIRVHVNLPDTILHLCPTARTALPARINVRSSANVTAKSNS